MKANCELKLTVSIGQDHGDPVHKNHQPLRILQSICLKLFFCS